MRLAIDFDGTIADTNRAKADWILGKLGVIVEPWRCDRSNCVPIIGAAAYEDMSDNVYERASTLATSEVPGASAALLRLSARAELHIVTARPARRMEFAREWIVQKILHLINGFHSSYDTAKEEICRLLGVSVLVDDDRRHLEAVRLAGLHRILFQTASDDATRSTGEMIVCRSWPEVVDALETGCFGDTMGSLDASDGPAI
jgi:hypothetical protein